MSSVSPDSSVSQMVVTTGGSIVAAPSQELLANLDPSTAARLLFEYYAAVVANSSEVASSAVAAASATSKSSRGRPGRRERQASLAAEAARWRDKPGYCYTRLLSDSSIARVVAELGSSPTLSAVCGIRAEDVRPLENLTNLFISYRDDTYHVSTTGGEPLSEFFRRCASAHRGRSGLLMNVFGTAPFGSEPVVWGAVVGALLPRAECIEISAGLSSYSVCAPAAPGSPAKVVFPGSTVDREVFVEPGVRCVGFACDAEVVGPAWVFFSGGKDFSVEFEPVSSVVQGFNGSIRDVGSREVFGGLGDGKPPDGCYQRVQWEESAERSTDSELSIDVSLAQAGARTVRVKWQVTIPRGLPCTMVSDYSYSVVDFAEFLERANWWWANEGCCLPLSFRVVDGRVTVLAAGRVGPPGPVDRGWY